MSVATETFVDESKDPERGLGLGVHWVPPTEKVDVKPGVLK